MRQPGDDDVIKPKTIMDLKNITSLLSNIPSSTSVEMKEVSQISDGIQLDLTVPKPTIQNSSLEKTPLSAIGTNLLPSNISTLHGKLSYMVNLRIVNYYNCFIIVLALDIIFN